MFINCVSREGSILIARVLFCFDDGREILVTWLLNNTSFISLPISPDFVRYSKSLLFTESMLPGKFVITTQTTKCGDRNPDPLTLQMRTSQPTYPIHVDSPTGLPYTCELPDPLTLHIITRRRPSNQTPQTAFPSPAHNNEDGTKKGC